MNKDTVFRDLYFFTLQFGIGSLLCFGLRQKEIIIIKRKVYLCGAIFNIFYLALIYAIYFIEGAERYFNSMKTEKWGIATGFIIFIVLSVLKLSTIKTEK